MATRKIKDAKDLSTNELIYFKGHAQATFMSDGRTVEEAVNSISGRFDEDSDIFILDLFGIAGYPDVNDMTNTGTIEFTVDSELMSMINSAIQKNKLVIRVDYADLYNLEIDCSTNTYLLIHSYFKYVGKFVQIDIFINRRELKGTFSISANATDLSQKQDTLVSGENIKTINGESILGSGDIIISDGRKEIVEVNTANGSILFLGTEYRPSFEPNKIYYATDVVSEDLTIDSVVQPTDDIGEYSLHFTTIANESWVGILSINTPSNWLWANGKMPSLEVNTHYELSVVATKFGTDYVYKAVLTPFKLVE